MDLPDIFHSESEHQQVELKKSQKKKGKSKETWSRLWKQINIVHELKNPPKEKIKPTLTFTRLEPLNLNNSLGKKPNLKNSQNKTIRNLPTFSPGIFPYKSIEQLYFRAVSYTHLTLPTILLVQISGVAVSLKKKNTKRYVAKRKPKTTARHRLYACEGKMNCRAVR
eukprot:TRINITY_DN46987_c0_g1_i1.p1 TRINITY_DN46987_c0_g1~~TRINITY_DN46987_c0_g1_i1.p1  ORF type:complete len:167 (+),score=14.74 TRINITY_DN46987_c0_g1_i1:1-501(+)